MPKPRLYSLALAGKSRSALESKRTDPSRRKVVVSAGAARRSGQATTMEGADYGKEEPRSDQRYGNRWLRS